MTGIHSQATTLPVSAQSLGKVESRIIRNRRSLDSIRKASRLQFFLNARELRYREGTLQWIVAACVKERDDSRLVAEELLERDSSARVILKACLPDFLATAAAAGSP
jgi:hypothetical protein